RPRDKKSPRRISIDQGHQKSPRNTPGSSLRLSCLPSTAFSAVGPKLKRPFSTTGEFSTRFTSRKTLRRRTGSRSSDRESIFRHKKNPKNRRSQVSRDLSSEFELKCERAFIDWTLVEETNLTRLRPDTRVHPPLSISDCSHPTFRHVCESIRSGMGSFLSRDRVASRSRFLSSQLWHVTFGRCGQFVLRRRNSLGFGSIPIPGQKNLRRDGRSPFCSANGRGRNFARRDLLS